ncbi:MAG: hypothetical protein O3C63_03890 [Cyanobacteria bacterium]|nr:hypothetical protein [Cyanobacteriota bacterium]
MADSANPISALGLNYSQVQRFKNNEVAFFDFMDSLLKTQLRYFAPDAVPNKLDEGHTHFQTLATLRKVFLGDKETTNKKELVREWLRELSVDPEYANQVDLLSLITAMQLRTQKTNQGIQQTKLEQLEQHALDDNLVLFSRNLEKTRLLVDMGGIDCEVKFGADQKLTVTKLKEQTMSIAAYTALEPELSPWVVSDNADLTQQKSLKVLVPDGKPEVFYDLRPVGFLEINRNIANRRLKQRQKAGKGSIAPGRLSRKFVLDNVDSIHTNIMRITRYITGQLILAKPRDSKATEFYIGGTICRVKRGL